MTILEIIKKRRSVRRFQQKEIPKEVINKLIEALIWAPSAGNLQSRKFYFVFNKEIKEKLAKAAFDQKFISQAPLVVVGCCDFEIEWKYGERGKSLYSICDVSASIQNLMLLAHSEGLGSVWVGAFDEKEVSEILNLPEPRTRSKASVLDKSRTELRSGAGNLRPIVIVPVGWPAEKPLPPSRISKKEAVESLK